MKSCFISANYDADITTITSVLHSKSINTIRIDKLTLFGEIISDEILKQIRQCDIVVGLLESNKNNQSVYFEIGIAYALRKDIILIVPPNYSEIPIELKNVFTIRTELKNEEAISYAIDKFDLKPKRKTKSIANILKVGTPIGLKANQLLKEFYLYGDDITEVQIIQLISQALETSGVTYYSSQKEKDIGVDVAIWEDKLSPIFGNPFLIEIRKKLTNKNQIEKLKKQLNKYINNYSKSNWILLIYVTGSDHLINIIEQSNINILTISIEDLLMKLSNDSLAKILVDLRNKKIHHGVS